VLSSAAQVQHASSMALYTDLYGIDKKNGTGDLSSQDWSFTDVQTSQRTFESMTADHMITILLRPTSRH